MVFPQTLAVLGGVLVALVYAFAVLGIGALTVRVCLGSQTVREWTRRDGPWAAVALAFITGQGLVGLLWLGLALAGALVSQAVWSFVVGGWLALFLSRTSFFAQGFLRRNVEDKPGLYGWIRRGILLLLILRALSAMLPTKNDDALLMYLVTPRMVAFSHTLEFQPYVMQHGLMPLQIEMHWAALFAVSNETAVTFWDYLCSLGTLAALAALGTTFQLESRAASVLLLTMVTTPAFTLLMGGGKPDNAAAQFGLAAFLWLQASQVGASRAALLSGLCLGWSLASRYTSFILGFAWLLTLVRTRGPRSRLGLFVAATLGASIAWAPMLFKNWLFVGYPLAPLLGDPNSFWFWRVSDAVWNLSWVDVLLYPFVWTFGDRPFMLGNVSPLFLGLLVPWFIYRNAPAVYRVRAPLGLGMLVLGTWVVFQARALHTRYLLVGLALAAVGLAPAYVAFDQALAERPRLQVGARAGLVLLLGFWLTVSSWSAYEAVRYAAGLDHRSDRYRRKDGYDVAEWLNARVAVGERVSLLGYSQYRYLLRPDILESSESRTELEWAWKAPRDQAWATTLARLSIQGGFRHVVAPREAAQSLVEALPRDSLLAFTGRRYVVLTLAPRSGAPPSTADPQLLKNGPVPRGRMPSVVQPALEMTQGPRASAGVGRSRRPPAIAADD